MVRETFGRAVDDALAALAYAGVPRAAVATIRHRLRADKAIVAAALDVAGGRKDSAALRRAIAGLSWSGDQGQQRAVLAQVLPPADSSVAAARETGGAPAD